ncbi:aspartyl/glutamyl-tRNA(Asn/Gln) amidotransferase subunit A [Colwellia chukchiensis]|uniref:Aspartyl/glutamyl-tRNA(Asn/Gln) amidotransferase subunit A n=1 Tax=Colwellia chukchiensis TaxID=641665 RepID=A0A1H7K2W2_9GAMM|nr:amidase [Colwellia chukchiensis]SEK81251.1 aspartyl/glutamyl-tRNA(Asn/Gln) amidotransferase subunit A [Colwellia chukchiensis]
MIDIDVLQLDLHEQISLVKSKQLSAEELMLQQQALIDVVNPKVNAFISVNEQNTHALNMHSLSNKTLNSASPSENIFAGVSIAIKDNIDVLGFNSTAGLETRRNVTAKSDAFVVDRLRQAGATFSGKLNMHEGALGASNQNLHYGNCYNPHQLSLSPGGSSGGSGAAVASCMTALALGTDTMGSVRIPASYCGVFGFKPSRGALSNHGTVICSRVMDTIGPLARSARDLTKAFNIMAGYHMEDAQSQSINFIKTLPNKPVILVPENLESLGVEADVIEDFNKNIAIFTSLGCQLKPFSFNDSGFGKYDFGEARRAGLIICEAEMRVEHEQDWQTHLNQFSPYLQQLLSYIDKKSPMDVIKSERVLDQAVVKLRQLLAQGDFMLMPTTPQRAFSFTDSAPANQADLTSLVNQAGAAAVSMPMLTDNALPIGLQLIGAHGSDLQLLALAEKWQHMTEFKYKMPQAIVNLVEQS